MTAAGPVALAVAVALLGCSDRKKEEAMPSKSPKQAAKGPAAEDAGSRSVAPDDGGGVTPAPRAGPAPAAAVEHPAAPIDRLRSLTAMAGGLPLESPASCFVPRTRPTLVLDAGRLTALPIDFIWTNLESMAVSIFYHLEALARSQQRTGMDLDIPGARRRLESSLPDPVPLNLLAVQLDERVGDDLAGGGRFARARGEVFLIDGSVGAVACAAPFDLTIGEPPAGPIRWRNEPWRDHGRVWHRWLPHDVHDRMIRMIGEAARQKLAARGIAIALVP
jgi:hypothetical protein